MARRAGEQRTTSRRRAGGLGLAAALLALGGLPAVAGAQQASLQGIVTSSSTGSPLEGVAVLLQTGGKQLYGVATNREGYYQIGGIRPGSYTVTVRHIGYAPLEQKLTLGPGERRRASFTLELSPVELKGIEVSPDRGAAVHELGRQTVTPADLRRIPTPAGSGDLATYIQTLPGVATTSDRGGQIYVRGGTPAENLVLVDGIPIYQPYHIVGFFSVFPEDLVSSADFYAGGFGARYSGRTSSVLDVRLRDGNMKQRRGMVSASPFLVEGMAEGPMGKNTSWIASARRSLIEETSGALLGEKQPYTFDSQMLKLTTVNGEDQRCSVLGLRSSDRGRIDPEETASHIGWQNLLLGGRCVTQSTSFLRLVEVNFSYSSFDNQAISEGSSIFSSRIQRLEHDAHVTTMVGRLPIFTGYHLYSEFMRSNLVELFGISTGDQPTMGIDGYVETGISLGKRGEVRPGVALIGIPSQGVEPRLRWNWQPFGRSSEKIQGALGVYRQDVLGTSDMRDVSNVFVAWMRAPNDVPLTARQASLGWEQSLGGSLRWSTEGYYKEMRDIPVAAWQALAQFTTRLVRAQGVTRGVDTRIELNTPHLYGFVGWGYGFTVYEVFQPEFQAWFGESSERYHPPHDRRNQVNAVLSAEGGGFKASARWQFGSGLPFTRPQGFDEAFDYTIKLYNVRQELGSTRLVLDRPFNGRLPMMHRLDVSLERSFDLGAGKLQLQAGAINAYNRRNMFYYDLFTGRRADQLPLSPYASVTLRSNSTTR